MRTNGVFNLIIGPIVDTGLRTCVSTKTAAQSNPYLERDSMALTCQVANYMTPVLPGPHMVCRHNNVMSMSIPCQEGLHETRAVE